MQGVPKLCDPLRNFRTKSRKSTKFGDYTNKSSTNLFDHLEGPGSFGRPHSSKSWLSE